jgi:hypothetical protein
LRSEDNGKLWSGANAGLLDLTALCVALSPWFERDHSGFVGTASGLYRTRNSARAWRAVETGFDDEAFQCIAVSPRFAEDRLVVAGTESSGLVWSTDGGTTWQHALEGSVTALAFSAAGTLAAATEHGVAVSEDGAHTWRHVGEAPGDVLCLTWIGDSLLAGLDRVGVARSSDGGATWRLSNDGLYARVGTALTLDAQGMPVVATLEDGTASVQRGMSLTADGDSPHTFDGEIVAMEQADDTVFVVTRGEELVLWRSADKGVSWQRWWVGPSAAVVPLAVSPRYRIDEAVYVGVGNQVLHPMRSTRERRGGESRPMWRAAELLGAAAVTSLAIAEHTVIAGTNAGVFISRDAGDSFVHWSEGLKPAGVVALTVANDTVYVLGLGATVWSRDLRDE